VCGLISRNIAADEVQSVVLDREVGHSIGVGPPCQFAKGYAPESARTCPKSEPEETPRMGRSAYAEKT
jgi:hypothetical protein